MCEIINYCFREDIKKHGKSPSPKSRMSISSHISEETSQSDTSELVSRTLKYLLYNIKSE